MDFSSVFEEIGEFGPYQCVVCFFLAASMVPAVFSNLNTVFIMGVTEHWCAVPELDHLKSSEFEIKQATIPLASVGDYESCLMYARNYTGWDEADVAYFSEGNWNNATVTECHDGWLFDTEVFGETSTTQMELVCDLRWWQAAAASSFALGLFVSMLLIVVELIGPRWRPHVNAWYGYLWSLGGLLMCALAYFIRQWRVLQITLSALCCLLLVYFWVPESPRWLYMQGRKTEADKIFQKIADSNNRQFNAADQPEIQKEETEKGYIWHMFANKRLAATSVAMCINWFAASLCYYGLTFSATSIGSNEYASFAISLFVELPAIVLVHLAAVHLGRRLSLVVAMIAGGACLLATLAFSPGSVGLQTFVNLGKIACSFSFNLLYIYVVEVYPTVIRSVGSCTGNFVARLAAILAPFIAQLGDFATYLPLLVYGASSLLAGLAALLLPETRGIQLEDNLLRSAAQPVKSVNGLSSISACTENTCSTRL